MPSGARRKYSENREALRHFDLIGLATKMFDFTFLLIMWAAALRRGRLPPPPSHTQHSTFFRHASCGGHISAVHVARRTIIESFVQGMVYPMSLMYTLFIFVLVLASPFFFGFLAIIPAFIHDFLINAANSMKTKKEDEDNEGKDDKSIEMTTVSTDKSKTTTAS